MKKELLNTKVIYAVTGKEEFILPKGILVPLSKLYFLDKTSEAFIHWFFILIGILLLLIINLGVC
jgi:hypothetical protein